MRISFLGRAGHKISQRLPEETMATLHDLSAAELSTAYRTRQVSPVDART